MIELSRDQSGYAEEIARDTDAHRQDQCAQGVPAAEQNFYITSACTNQPRGTFSEIRETWQNTQE